jgi:excisionase family DNA binding protein
MATTPSSSSDYDSLLGAVRLVIRQELKAYSIKGQMLPVEPTEANQQADTDEALTIGQTARLLGVAYDTVYALVHRGVLPTHKRGRRYFWKKSEVLAHMHAQATPKKVARAAQQLARHT